MTKINIILLMMLISILAVAVYFIKYQASNRKNTEFPMFMSTKDLQTNVRSGPSAEYPILWVYSAQYIPIKVTATYDAWYKIEDVSGNIGWINKSLLSLKRTGIVKVDSADVYHIPKVSSRLVAIVKKNVLVEIKNCEDNLYCKVKILENSNTKNIAGWMLKNSIWGSD